MIQLSILRLPHSILKWGLVGEYLKLRKRVFIDEMGWGLQTDLNELENEEYDASNYPHYVIAQRDNRVVAGARLLRCDTEFGRAGEEQRTYMIRDATLGRINLPTNLTTDPPPTDPSSWELTRLVSVDKNPATSQAIMRASYDYMQKQGAKQVLLLARPAIMRFVRQSGYDPKPIGPIVKNESGSFLAFKCIIK